MHRLKLLELSENPPSPWFADYSELYPPCAKAAKIYDASIKRASGLTGSIGYAFMHGELWMNASYLAGEALPNVDRGSQEFQVKCLQEFTKVSKWPDAKAFIEDHRKATHNADEHCHQIQPIYEGFKA